MIVAGVGCKRGAPAPDIEAAIRAALARAEIAAAALDGIATIAAKRAEAGIQAVAEKLGVSVVAGLGRRICRAANDRTRNPIRARARTHRRAVGRGSRSACRGGTVGAAHQPATRHRRRDLRARRFGGGAMTVHFIGAGPGAADLITVRGRDLIARCPVCLYAGSIVPRELLGYCPPGARIVDTAPLSLDEIEAEFAAAHAAGLDVARLHSGDLSIYWRSPSNCAGSPGAAYLIR